jgi:hypothetical protein
MDIICSNASALTFAAPPFWEAQNLLAPFGKAESDLGVFPVAFL